MALTLGDNFSYQGAKPLDGRLKYDTLAAMKAVADATMYDGCMAYCVATDKTYQWKSSNTVDTNTGRWREFSSGGSGVTNYNDLNNRPLIEGVTLTGNKTASDLGLAKTSDLPSVYEGDTAGLVPAAGSDNEGKYLDNDGNWTDPLEDFVQNSGGKVLLDIPKNTYSTYTEAFAVVKALFDTLTREQLASIVVLFGKRAFYYERYKGDDADGTFYGFTHSEIDYSTNQAWLYIAKISSNAGIYGGIWKLKNANNQMEYATYNYSSSAQDTAIQVIDTSVSATMIGKINRSDIYDTTEKVVGKWTDGRPLYQVCIETTMPVVTTEGTKVTKNIEFDTTKIIQNIVGVIHATSSSSLNTRVLPAFSHSTDVFLPTGNIYRNSSGTLIIQSQTTNDNNKPVTLTIQYTKTTDAANSYNYADENDYSTSEKIIGKWIDGKTLYQKTYTKTFDLTSTSAETVIDVASISGVNIVDFIGFVIKDSGLRVPVGSRITDTNYYVVRTNDSNSSIKLQARGTSIANDSGTLYLTLKYTKS